MPAVTDGSEPTSLFRSDLNRNGLCFFIPLCRRIYFAQKDRRCFVFQPVDGHPTGSSIRAAQPITDPGFGQDELRAFVVGFNFLSELPNKDPQILRIGKVVPELLE